MIATAHVHGLAGDSVNAAWRSSQRWTSTPWSTMTVPNAIVLTAMNALQKESASG
jgi:hypothetical protein